MATTLVSSLITRAAAAADMEDNFVTSAQWVQWANVENRRLAGVVAGLGYPLFENNEPITLNGSAQYSLPEPLALIAVYFAESDGRWRKLRLDHPVQNQGTAANYGTPVSYHVFRNTNGNITFQFHPNPATGIIQVKQIDHPSELVISNPSPTQSDSVSYPLNWEERIVLGMARRALAKEETLNPLIEQQIAELDDHIATTAWNYQAADAPRIRDVRKDNVVDWPDIWMYF